MRRYGFTFIELIVVLSIISIMAAILFPVFARARESARQVSCANNLAQMGVALSMYAQNYDGHYPHKDNDYQTLYEYTHALDTFFCPSDPAEREFEMKTVRSETQDGMVTAENVPVITYSSYVYKGGFTTDDPENTPVASEAWTWHVGAANVLYLDGHVKSVPKERFEPVTEPVEKPAKERAR